MVYTPGRGGAGVQEVILRAINKQTHWFESAKST
jgi:hypothetical protein